MMRENRVSGASGANICPLPELLSKCATYNGMLNRKYGSYRQKGARGPDTSHVNERKGDACPHSAPA